MAWTTPATWSVGESPTASKMNTHIRDNLIALRDENPTCSLTTNAAQSISNATWTAISFDIENYDSAGLHDNVNPTRITIPVAGRYSLTANVGFQSASNSVGLGIRFNINGSVPVAQVIVAGCSQTGNGPCTAAMLDFAASQYVEVECYQNSGGTLNTSAGYASLTFTASRQ